MPHKKTRCPQCARWVETRGLKSHFLTHRDKGIKQQPVATSPTEPVIKNGHPPPDLTQAERDAFREGYRIGFQDAMASLKAS
jgi:hypothetical protein